MNIVIISSVIAANFIALIAWILFSIFSSDKINRIDGVVDHLLTLLLFLAISTSWAFWEQEERTKELQQKINYIQQEQHRANQNLYQYIKSNDPHSSYLPPVSLNEHLEELQEEKED
mgnify:CR=1 FL=1